MNRAELKPGRPNSAAQRVASPSSPMSSAGSVSPVTSPRLRRPMTTTTDEMLYAKPASVHFGGFVLERTVQQRVRVHNNSAKAVRLRYIFPTGKKGFRATFASADRPSFVSAGLSEEIIVSFTPPAGFQYYYDCIQVRSEEVAYGSNTDVARGGATLIPLHAYPTVNEVTFPTRMDFGNVSRGSCARKHVAITCSVPVEFEYELRMTKAHPAFTVFPLTGIIPPRGEARIELEFRPVVYATASAELELHVSQLGFTPRICTLAGSSSSTAVDTVSVIDVAKTKGNSSASPALEEKSRRRTEAQGKTSKPRTSQSQAKSSSKKYTQDEPQYEDVDNDEVELEKVRGVEIPHNLNSVTGITFVLNQEPGKLKPKDLKKAIAANRALRQQQREEQAKLNTRNVSSEENEDAITLSFQTLMREEQGFLDRVRVSKQVKDMFFQQELREVAEAEKALEFQSHKVHLGQRLLSPEQVSRLVALRELNFQALTRQQREQLRTMFINVCYEPPVVSDRQRQPNGNNQPLLLGELKTAVLPAKFIPAYSPDFKLYKNDLWARRQRVLRRLIRAVSTCILRLRAQKRLDRIRTWMGGAKTRAQIREKVTMDWQLSDQSGGDSGVLTKTEKTAALTQTPDLDVLDSVSTSAQDRYYLSSFPLVKESTTQKRRENVEVPADWELKFNSFTFMELKPRSEALLMGHEPLLLPALPTHVPLEHARILRQGAEGECSVVSSLLPPVASDTGQSLAVKMPSMLGMVPSDVFLRPQASVRPLMTLQRPRETEPGYTLRPCRVFRTSPSSFSAWQNSQLGLQSVMGSHDGARLYLSDIFVNSVDRKLVEPIFPTPVRSATNENRSIFGDVWNVSNMIVPHLAERAEDVPSLSDSESDDEGESSGTGISWKHARDLFEDFTAEQVDGGSNGYEDGELLGYEKGIYSFERYRHLIRQERSYNTHRQEFLERLPKLLDGVAAQIDHPDYELVVQGHGPERPLHHQKLRKSTKETVFVSNC